MAAVEEIKSAMAGLSLGERAELIAELYGWAEDAWDKQMKRDHRSGRFDAMNSAADQAELAGTTVRLEQILDQT